MPNPPNWHVHKREGYEDDIVIADFISCQGDHREHMEDGFVIKHLRLKNSDNMTCYMAALMDGHAGDEVMEYILKYLPKAFKKALSGHSFHQLTSIILQKIVTKACLKLNEDIRRVIKRQDIGSTLSVFLLFHHPTHGVKACVLNVGDSMIAVAKHVGDHPWNSRCKECMERLKMVTEMHDLSNKKELKRFQQQTELTTQDGYILNKQLSGVNMTRAFGDFHLGKFVQPIPTIGFLNSPVCFVTIGSDGIWDSVTPKEIDMWMKQKGCEDTQCLMNERAKEVQHDNFTLGVLFINNKIPWVTWA